MGGVTRFIYRRRRGHQSCLARKEPIPRWTAPAASSLHPASATIPMPIKVMGGGFKISPPQGPAEINEPRLQSLQSSNTPQTMGPPAEVEYRE